MGDEQRTLPQRPVSRRNLRLSVIKCINVMKSQIDTWSIKKSKISQSAAVGCRPEGGSGEGFCAVPKTLSPALLVERADSVSVSRIDRTTGDLCPLHSQRI